MVRLEDALDRATTVGERLRRENARLEAENEILTNQRDIARQARAAIVVSVDQVVKECHRLRAALEDCHDHRIATERERHARIIAEAVNQVENEIEDEMWRLEREFLEASFRDQEAIEKNSDDRASTWVDAHNAFVSLRNLRALDREEENG